MSELQKVLDARIQKFKEVQDNFIKADLTQASHWEEPVRQIAASPEFAQERTQYNPPNSNARFAFALSRFRAFAFVRY
jgi:hypothetical protein